MTTYLNVSSAEDNVDQCASFIQTFTMQLWDA